MRSFALVSLLAGIAAAKNAVPSLWDGSCYYPRPDIGFELDSYLGRWYQVAGTIAPYNEGCKCTFAQYGLSVRLSYPLHYYYDCLPDFFSQDNGTIRVNNTCQAGDRPVSIVGTATPVGPEYGATGVFQVQFPGERPPDCPGPNYIVQGMPNDPWLEW